MFRKYRHLGFPFHYSVVVAIGISAFLILQEFMGHTIHGYNFPFSWFAISAKTLLTYILWAFFLPFVQNISKSIQSKGTRDVLLSVLMSFLVAFVHRVMLVLIYNLAYLVYEGVWQDLFHTRNLVLFWAGYFSGVLQFWIITGVFLAIGYYRSYLEKQKELTNAELNALKMQLHPHFLFNTLHAISSLMDQDVKGAQKMITQLGDLLRSILEKNQSHTISLREELAYIKNYLEIERVRFQDRLRIDYRVDPEVLAARVPTLILQPLVENAIKHGISHKEAGGDIRIEARLIKEAARPFVELSVADNGLGRNEMYNGKRSRKGLGIANVRQRLNRLYKEDFKLETASIRGDSGGYKALISFPFTK